MIAKISIRVRNRNFQREIFRMPRRKVQKEPEINSDDELSASGPEISDDEMMSEDGLPEHEVMRVQGIGCECSEEIYYKNY